MPTSILERPLRLFTVRHHVTDEVLRVTLHEREAHRFRETYGLARCRVAAQQITALGEPTPIPRRKGGRA